MKYLIEFFRTVLPQGLSRLRFNFFWALMALFVGLAHTGAIMALLSLKLISETVALAVLDHSLSLTVVLCILGALFPSKSRKHNEKDETNPDQ